ncbi:MAG: hypothetical protein GY830_11110 [Bacteroidetes bacterium]|nr:hypothetical protein [Bacteroidota bacterium]
MKNFKILLGTLIISTLLILYVKKNRTSNNIKKEKVLRNVVSSKVKTFDPTRSNDIYCARQIAKIYDTLLEYDYLERPFKLKPSLLEEMPEISEDQLTYTFKLKKGILFHRDECFENDKQRELQAKDVIYTLKRMADVKTMSNSYGYIQNRIKGLDEWRRKYKDGNADYDEKIEGLQELDKYSFRIKLKSPFSEILNIFVLPGYSIISKIAYQKYKEDLAKHPVGTGPFYIKEFNPQSNEIIYYKNPDFRDEYFPTHGAAEYQEMIDKYGGKKMPFVDKIITKIIVEESPKWLKFNNNEIDYMNITCHSNLKNILDETSTDLKEEYKAKGLDLLVAIGQSTNFFCFNNIHPLFKDNINLRRAMNLAFDRETYKNLFFTKIDKNAQSIIPPGLSGYDYNYKNEFCEYNLKKAKEYIIKSGYYNKKIPVITLETGTSIKDRQKAEFLKKCMREIGIEIKIQTNTWPAIANKINKKEYMMTKMGWYADYNSGKPFLDTFYGHNEAQGLNYTYFNNEEYNQIFEKTAFMRNMKDKDRAFQKLNRIIGDSLPVLFLFHTAHYIIKKSKVKNYLYVTFIYGNEKYVDVVS